MSADLPALLTAKMIREHVLPIGRRTFQRYLAGGEFPPPDLRIGGKGFWRRETVENWIEEHAETTRALTR